MFFIQLFITIICALLVILLHYAASRVALLTFGFDARRDNGAIKHIDPLGAILFVFTGYGWANPMPGPAVYPLNRQTALISARVFPLVINLTFGVCAAVLYKAVVASELSFWFAYSISKFAALCVCFALVNVIPIPPLDGAEVLSLILRPETRVKFQNITWVLQAVLVIALISGFIGNILSPVAEGLLTLLMSTGAAV